MEILYRDIKIFRHPGYYSIGVLTSSYVLNEARLRIGSLVGVSRNKHLAVDKIEISIERTKGLYLTTDNLLISNYNRLCIDLNNRTISRARNFREFVKFRALTDRKASNRKKIILSNKPL
jgi:hypothetical protein